MYTIGLVLLSGNEIQMLTLIGGTEFKGDGQAAPANRAKKVAAATTPAQQTELAEQARQLVLEYELGGKTVRDWMRTPDLLDHVDLASARAFTNSMLLLNKVGIMLLKNGHEHGMVNDTYGTVVDAKLLARRIPQLKKFGLELTGLALYY